MPVPYLQLAELAGADRARVSSVFPLSLGGQMTAMALGGRMTSLAQQVRRLERGDCFEVVRDIGDGSLDDAPGADVADLMTAMMACVARSMCMQTVSRYQEADAAIRRAQSYQDALTTMPQRVDPETAWWRARAGRVLERERLELDQLRLLMASVGRGQPEIVYAAIEYFCWVEYQPRLYLVRRGDMARVIRDPNFPGLEPTRQSMMARAGALRGLGDGRSGTPTVRTWKRMGGFQDVRKEAFAILAKEPVLRSVPTGDDARGQAFLAERSAKGALDERRYLAVAPPRLGRLRAWQAARQFVSDLC